jgi:diguanylate cyclase (GGDEF)-like protein
LPSVHRDGRPCTLQVTVSAVLNLDGTVAHYIMTMLETPEAKPPAPAPIHPETTLALDPLTQLPLRDALSALIREAMQGVEREGSLLAVLYLDLDHFQSVNEQLGVEGGNAILCEVAQRLQAGAAQWSPDWNAVARIGADEFVLLLRTSSQEACRQLIERAKRRVTKPYRLLGHDAALELTCSIGATLYPLDDTDGDTLLRHADQAMYAAKQTGRNGHKMFDTEDRHRREAQAQALGRVRRALDEDQLLLNYQPEVDLRTGTVIGVEALLRWSHPVHGVIPPAQFLPLVENTPLGEEISHWVLQQALEQSARWQAEGLDLLVHVNISANHLQSRDFVTQLRSLLEKHPSIIAERLVLEILETTALEDIDFTISVIQSCRGLGVRFALDDFGTGYSTLTYLKRLPLDILKIDRTFVNNMLSDPLDLGIVEGVIGLSRAFGCEIIAEGVNSTAQARKLIEIGCHLAQGNGIAPAMPADRVRPWLESYEIQPELAALGSPA